MSEGRYTDAATRLVIEEAIGDQVFKALKAGYNRIPFVKPAVQAIGKHAVKPLVGAAVANPGVATAGILAAAEATFPAPLGGNKRGAYPIKGPDGKETYGTLEEYNRQQEFKPITKPWTKEDALRFWSTQ